MNLIVQRYTISDLLYTDKVIENIYPEKGLVGPFHSTFGKMVSESGEFICYTLERRDTLISEGERKYKFYDSPANHRTVLLLEDEPGSNTYDRKIEVHIANWAYQLKGCTAVGRIINPCVPELQASSFAFNKIMSFVGKKEGFITHETLKQNE